MLFTCYRAAALVAVRQKTTRPNPYISTGGMSLEWEYADDVDFADEEREPLDVVLSTACPAENKRPNPPISTWGMPLVCEYSDDVDFADKE